MEGDGRSVKALDRLQQQKAHFTGGDQAVASRTIPPFSALPLQKDGPPYSAWGLYGPHDQLGTLNRLTDSMVAQAAKEEIQTGARYALRCIL